jgi:hypothetical protein
MINPALDTKMNSELACLFAQIPVDTLVLIAVAKLDEIQNMKVSNTSFSDACNAFKFWTIFNDGYKWYAGKDLDFKIWMEVCKSVLELRPNYFKDSYLPVVCDAYNKANVSAYNFHLLEKGEPVNFVERMVAGTKHLRLEQVSSLHRKYDESALRAELFLYDFKNVASVRKKFTDCRLSRSIYVQDNSPFKVHYVLELPDGSTVERKEDCKLGVDYDFKKLNMEMNEKKGGIEGVRLEVWRKLGGL